MLLIQKSDLYPGLTQSSVCLWIADTVLFLENGEFAKGREMDEDLASS